MLGPNGAGKSTLLAALGRARWPERGRGRAQRPRGGRAAVARARAAAPRCANVEAALAWWGVPRARARASARSRALRALRRRRTSPTARRRTLSGGEARRVHLARALALSSADALLLDEPFAGLDAVSRADLLYDAASALRDGGRATLVVVHDRAEAWALADRVLILLDGRAGRRGPAARAARAPADRPRWRASSGFAGELEEPAGTRMLRPAHVRLDRGGPARAAAWSAACRSRTACASS